MTNSKQIKNFINRINIEDALYFGAFLLGLVLRFKDLSRIPLNDNEAELALAALREIPLNNTFSQPLLLLLAKAMFFIFGTSNFSMRFWPAIIGSMLVITPMLYRKLFGRVPAIALAFCFALDPLLIAASRQVDSRSLAVTMLFASIGFMLSAKPLIAGALTALSLMCGSSIWLEFSALAISVGIIYLLSRGRSLVDFPHISIKKPDLQRFFTAFSVSLIMFGSYFFTQFKALNYLSNGFLQFILGWMPLTATSISAFQKIFIFISYLPLGIMFIILSMVLVLNHKTIISKFLFVFLGVNIILVIVYPSPSISEMVWLSMAIWLVSAYVIGTRIKNYAICSKGAFPLVLITVSLLVYSWFELLYVQSLMSINLALNLAIASVIGGLVLLGLIIILYALGWSRSQAFRGFFVGLFLFFLILQVAMSFRAADIGDSGEFEVISTSYYFKDANLISDTLEKLSLWKSGVRNSLNIAIMKESATPSLMWLIRDYKTVLCIDECVLNDSDADVFITAEAEPELYQDYRGQSFVIYSKPFWATMKGAPLRNPDFRQWFFFRKCALQQNEIVLWVREDLFLREIENNLNQTGN